MLPVEILPVQETLVLRARGSELLILPSHIKELKELSKPRDFSQYFRAEALLNRPARKLFEAWLRKDHTLWSRLYKVVHKEMELSEDSGDEGVAEKEAPKSKAKEAPKAKATAKAKPAKKKAAPKEEEEKPAAKAKPKAKKAAKKASSEKTTKKKVVAKKKAAPAKKKVAKKAPAKKTATKAAPKKKTAKKKTTKK